MVRDLLATEAAQLGGSLFLGSDCQGNIKEGNIRRNLPLDGRLRHVDIHSN